MIWDDPPHRCSILSQSSARDDGGGVELTYTTIQSAVPCLINTASASEQAIYSQQGIVVSHTVSFKSSVLTTALVRGVKLVAADSGASFHVEGISAGRAFGSIPAFTYAHCSEQV